MCAMRAQSKFIQTLGYEVQAIPPIWFMRQAGRYLPEYRAVREKAGSFLDLCYNSDLAAEVTLQPIERYDLDAAILFADILLIPDALGQTLTFEAGEGPKLRPLMNKELLEQFRHQDIHAHLSPVYETVAKTRNKLADDKALIGFAGAPWTVATYMLAGGSMRDPGSLRGHYYQDKAFIEGLIDLLTEKTIEYLLRQIEAGADAVQLFDTWAGGMPGPVIEKVSVRPMLKIAAAIKKQHADVPVIFFPRGVGEKSVEYVVDRACQGIGIDYAIDPGFARAQLSPFTTVQGGLDPLLVVSGGAPMFKAAESLLRLFHDVPYIFNLGHGFVPETPPEHVAQLVKFVREFQL